eukprot:144966_1
MSKLLFIKCKINNKEKRCKFNINDDLGTINGFIIKIADKLEFDLLENRPNDNNELESFEEEEEPQNNEQRIEIHPDDIVISYSIHGDGTHVILESDDELKEIIEFHCNEDEEDIKIKEFIVRKRTDEFVGNNAPNDKQALILKAQVMKLSMSNIPYKFTGKKKK